MTALRLTAFRGVVQKLAARLLPEANAVVAQNMKTTRGDLRPWNLPATVATCPAGTLGLYRMGRDTPSDANYWLTFTAYVDVIRGLVATDTTERTIYTGGGATEPRWTDNTMALASAPYPTAWRILGVPGPTTAPTIAVNTDPGGTTLTDINVLITFVNTLGEEGTISPVSNTLSVHAGSTIDVSSFPTVPSGSYGIAHYRIYATDIGNTTATYAFAADAALGSTTVTIDLGALGGGLETTDYDMPPADGHSICMVGNQFAAMLSGKSVRFSAPSLIYAWPVKYRMLIPDTPIGQGCFDQTLVVLTTGRPWIIQGGSPDAMTSTQVPLDEACVSKASIVTFGHAVVWASPNGLMALTNSGPSNLTDAVMAREDWQALVPSTIVGEQYLGLYFGSYDAGAGRKGFIIDPMRPDGIIFLPTGYPAMHFDTLRGALFVVATTNVQKWDAGAASTVTFTSKVFRLQAPASFSWAKLVADSYGQTVRFYADANDGAGMVLRFTKTVTSGVKFRLPVGFGGQEWQFSIDTTVGVQGLIVADSAQEVDG